MRGGESVQNPAEKKFPVRGLKALREDRKLSKAALGRRLGIATRSVVRYEKLERLPREELLYDLTVVLNCDHYLLFHANPIQVERRTREQRIQRLTFTGMLCAFRVGLAVPLNGRELAHRVCQRLDW
jgi:transcriptional regulator with XRE-family HTH domain